MYCYALSSMPETSRLDVLVCGSARSQLDFDGFYNAVRSLEREICVHRDGVLYSEVEVGREREVRRAKCGCVFVLVIGRDSVSLSNAQTASSSHMRFQISGRRVV